MKRIFAIRLAALPSPKYAKAIKCLETDDKAGALAIVEEYEKSIAEKETIKTPETPEEIYNNATNPIAQKLIEYIALSMVMKRYKPKPEQTPEIITQFAIFLKAWAHNKYLPSHIEQIIRNKERNQEPTLYEA